MGTFLTQRSALMLVLSVGVSATTWLYVRNVLEPWSEAKQRDEGIKAQMWDLYPRWAGARELLLHGRNPYGSEVSAEIQMAFYGHGVTPEESTRVMDEQRFAYPVYVVFFLAPTIHLDFATVKFWAPFVLAGFVVLTVLFCLELLKWRLPWESKIALILLVLSSPQIVQGVRHQQLALVVACALSAAAWCVNRGNLVTAGAVLAISTIKPQMALLPLLWFLIWSLGDWRGRWRLTAALTTALATLIAGGELLVPGWPGDFFRAIAAYRQYFPTESVLQFLLGSRAGFFLSFLVMIAVLAWGWANRKAGGSSPQFMATFSVFLIATLLTFPLLTPFNQALLILPALWVVRDWEGICAPGRVVFAAVVTWPWMVSAALLVWRPVQSPTSRVPLLPAVAEIGLPLLLPALLYVRRKAPAHEMEAADGLTVEGG